METELATKSSKSDETKERILKAAESIILGKGFSGTSLDEIIDQAGITKGGFFYHFDGKNDLAVQLIVRYLKNDDIFFEKIFSRADSLSDDPVQSLFIALKLFAEAMGDLPGVHPGCLVATFTYESQIFDPEVRGLVAEGVLRWRNLISGRLDKAKAFQPPIQDFDSYQIADMFTSTIEGGIILSRSLNDPNALPHQLLHYRNYVRLLFGY